MTNEDSVATTDENGISIEYVPMGQVRQAFIRGLYIGMFIMFVAALCIIWFG